MNITYARNNDVISGAQDLELLYSIKNFPVFMGASENSQEDDIFIDLNFQISKSTGMVQINPLIDLSIVYLKSHNPGTIGQIWKKHHEALADFLLKFDKKKVLEIGGYSGILANNCLSKNNEIEWTIIDPHAKHVNDNVKIINSFFDDQYLDETKYDLVVHSHLIEHVIDVNSFLKNCHSRLNKNGYMIFSLPNFELFLNKRITNSLHFEHTFHIDEYFLSKLFESHGFKIVEKTYYADGYNVFYCVEKTDPKNTAYDSSKYLEYKNLYLDYFKDIKSFIDDFNNSSDYDGVFMFGGHVTSQFLISLGLDQNKIKYLLDNDPNKQEKRLYGTNLQIKSPSILKNYNNPVLILKNSFFDEEIRKQVLEINESIKILTF